MSDSVQSVVNNISSIALQVAASSGIGYLCARAFTSVNPVHGAIFCGITVVVSKIVSPIFDAIFNRPGANQASKVLGDVCSIGTAIGGSAAIARGLGYPITFHSGLVLAGSTFLGIAAIVAVIGGGAIIISSKSTSKA